MTEFDSPPLSIESIQRVNLGVMPSETLVESLKPFYNEEAQDEAATTPLRSANYFEVTNYSSGLVRPHPHNPYDDAESFGLPSIQERMRMYTEKALANVADHSIRMATYFEVAETTRGGIRLFMSIMPTDEERAALGSLTDLNINRFRGGVRIYSDILPMHRVVGRDDFKKAYFDLRGLLRGGTALVRGGSLFDQPSPNELLFVSDPQLVFRPNNLHIVDQSQANENSQTA